MLNNQSLFNHLPFTIPDNWRPATGPCDIQNKRETGGQKPDAKDILTIKPAGCMNCAITVILNKIYAKNTYGCLQLS